INPTITCTISVTFSPRRLRARPGLLTIVQDLGTAKIKLTGFGIPGVGPTTGPSLAQPTTGPGGVPLGPVEGSGGVARYLRFVLLGGALVLLVRMGLLFLASRGRTADMREAADLLRPGTPAETGPEGDPWLFPTGEELLPFG